jgi:hypothetical protein
MPRWVECFPGRIYRKFIKNSRLIYNLKQTYPPSRCLADCLDADPEQAVIMPFCF